MTWFDWATGWIKWEAYEATDFEKRISSLERKVKDMADILDDLKADFEAYQTLVNTTLTALNQKITDLTSGQLDPAKAAAVDAEIKAAIAALTPAP